MREGRNVHDMKRKLPPRLQTFCSRFPRFNTSQVGEFADLEGRDKMIVCLRGRFAAGGRDAALSDGRDLSLVYLSELRRISV